MDQADHDPHLQPPAGWVAGDEWDTHRATIQELYQAQNMPLKDVMKVMEDRHGFRATQRMYKTRIKSWGLDKNFKESEVVELFRLRRERERAGKSAAAATYTIRGREVDWDRVNTYVRRKGLDIPRLVDTAPHLSPAAAREIACRTPSPAPDPAAAGVAAASYRHGGGLAPVDTYLDVTASPMSSSSMVSSAPSALSSSPGPGPAPALAASRTPISPSASHYSHHQPGPLPRQDDNSYHYQNTTATPASAPAPQSAEGLRVFQKFLTRAYHTVLFEDGDKAWGTTEYWLRNARSQEWIMTLRYKLAMYRGFVEAEAAAGSAAVRRFRALNRSFALLEPASAGIIGVRLFYLVNFFHAFGHASPFHNPFAATARQLAAVVHTACVELPPRYAPGSGCVDAGGGGDVV
ncbi:Clr5 domain-containing protein, partial [Lasiosphaeria ovina]